MITTEQIDTWIADAKKSTQGTMSVKEENNPSPFRWYVTEKNKPFATLLTHEQAKHIANLCPANAIAILEELKQLRRYAAQMESAYVEEVMK